MASAGGGLMVFLAALQSWLLQGTKRVDRLHRVQSEGVIGVAFCRSRPAVFLGLSLCCIAVEHCIS